MKILIDIGNTNTSIAVLSGEKIAKRFFIRTSKTELSQQALERLLKKYLKKCREVVIVQVVPRFFSLLKKNLKEIMPEVPLYLVGKDIEVPMKINYRNPEEVGQDRLVTSYGALCLYGSPAIVVDFGTAVTFDLVSEKGDYEGGLIFPGIRLALEALSSRTALLPKIELVPCRELPGKDTENSINTGVLYGYAGACDTIIEKLKSAMDADPTVVATGGDTALIARYTDSFDHVHEDLATEALAMLSKNISC